MLGVAQFLRLCLELTYSLVLASNDEPDNDAAKQQRCERTGSDEQNAEAAKTISKYLGKDFDVMAKS